MSGVETDDAYWSSVMADEAPAPVAVLPGNTAATGNTVLPVAHPTVSATGQHGRRQLYTDIAALLDDSLPRPPEPDVLRRGDGCGLFYSGQVNLVFGDPESGKTWICLAAVSEALTGGRSALILDLDHNGPQATVSRLIDLGAPETALRNPARFRTPNRRTAPRRWRLSLTRPTGVPSSSSSWTPSVKSCRCSAGPATPPMTSRA